MINDCKARVGGNMKCLEAQGLIMKYVNDELSGPQLESFLEHIDICPDCREELEIYYILTKGMKQLDNDFVDTYNFHEAFEKHLEKSKKDMDISSRGYLFKSIMLDIIILLVAILLSTDTSYRDYSVEDDYTIFNGISID